jgi:hypothetical protein
MTYGKAFRPQPLYGLAWCDWDAHDLALLEFETEQLVGAPKRATDEGDAELAQWFVDQQREVEQAVEAGRAAGVDELDSPGELILTRRREHRSRSWRGGGTMRRR